MHRVKVHINCEADELRRKEIAMHRKFNSKHGKSAISRIVGGGVFFHVHRNEKTVYMHINMKFLLKVNL